MPFCCLFHQGPSVGPRWFCACLVCATKALQWGSNCQIRHCAFCEATALCKRGLNFTHPDTPRAPQQAGPEVVSGGSDLCKCDQVSMA